MAISACLRYLDQKTRRWVIEVLLNRFGEYAHAYAGFTGIQILIGNAIDPWRLAGVALQFTKNHEQVLGIGDDFEPRH